MKEKIEDTIQPQESREEQKPHESIYMHEWMAKEMIDELKKQDHNPEEISFSAGFDKTSGGEGQPVRSPFFTMNFRDGKKWYRAYWNPETKGAKLEVEYSGEAVDDKEKL